MKNIIFPTLLFVAVISFAQTSVQFSKANQEFDFSKKHITIKFIINNLDSYDESKPITLEIRSDLDNRELIGITKTIGRDVIIPFNSSSYEIQIPVDPKILKTRKYLTLELKKKGSNDGFSVIKGAHTIILTKKPVSKATISIAKVEKDTKLKIDFSDDKEIEIPFILKVSGRQLKLKDEATVKVKISGLESYKKEISFKIIGQQSNHKLIIDRDSDEKLYKNFLTELKDKEKLEIVLTAPIAKKIEDKNAIQLDKKENKISYEIKKENKITSRYDFYLGTNFDLKDRFEATSFYAEIDAFLPELISNKWGLRGGIYKNNNSLSLEESIRQEVITETISTTSDSITFVGKRISRLPNISIENLGLYFQVSYKVFDSKSSNFKGYLSAHFETIERREKYTFNNTDLFALGEPVTISLDSLSQNNRLQALLAQPKEFTRKYYDSYYGLAFPMFLKNSNKNFEAFFNPIFGIGDPGLIPAREEDLLKSFGAFQFHIIVSEKNLSIKLGGEIRKYFNFFQDPIISINLSTRINLSGILAKKED